MAKSTRLIPTNSPNRIGTMVGLQALKLNATRQMRPKRPKKPKMYDAMQDFISRGGGNYG